MGLDVAMDDAAPVEVRQPVGHVHEHRHQHVRRQAATRVLEGVGERAVVAQLHHEERLSARRRVARVDVVDRDDPRVRGSSHAPCLPVEPARDKGVASEVREQHLDGDVPLESKVAGPIHHGRAARAEGSVDPVSPGQCVPDQRHAGERSGCARIGAPDGVAMFATLAGGYPRPTPPKVSGARRGSRGATPSEDVDPAIARSAEDDIVRAVIAEQEAAGLEFVTDGQVRWDDPISGIARRLDGFEIGPAAPYFSTPATYRRPIATSEPRWNGPITVDDWRFASSCTSAIVKQTIVGPYTLARLSDPGPLTRERLTMALADALSHELRRLEAEGCPLVQIDESAATMIGDSPNEQKLFKAAHRRLTNTVKGVHLSLAITMGNVERIPPRILFDAPYLSYLFDLAAAPQNWRPISFAPPERGIVCGIADAGSPSPDDPGLVAGPAATPPRCSGGAAIVSGSRRPRASSGCPRSTPGPRSRPWPGLPPRFTTSSSARTSRSTRGSWRTTACCGATLATFAGRPWRKPGPGPMAGRGSEAT